MLYGKKDFVGVIKNLEMKIKKKKKEPWDVEIILDYPGGSNVITWVP